MEENKNQKEVFKIQRWDSESFQIAFGLLALLAFLAALIFFFGF